jgi:hypothetical protein
MKAKPTKIALSKQMHLLEIFFPVFACHFLSLNGLKHHDKREYHEQHEVLYMRELDNACMCIHDSFISAR